MSIYWPSQIQQLLNQDSFSLKKGETLLRSDVDVGPKKVRRRFTRPVDTFTAGFNMTISEYAIFNTFFDTEVAGGATAFILNHPITGVATNVRFTGPPAIKSIGGGNFVASMEFEILP